MLQIAWLVPDRLLYLVGSGVVAADEIVQLDDWMHAHFERQSQPVHIICNGSAIEIAPSVKVMMSQRYLTHPQMGWYVHYNDTRDDVQRFLISTAARLVGARYAFADSHAHALQIMARLDPDLPPCEPDRDAVALRPLQTVATDALA